MSRTLRWGQTWPDREEFAAQAQRGHTVVVARKLLAEELTAVGVYRRLAAGREGSFLLESAEQGGQWGRWSFIGVNGRATLLGEAAGPGWRGEVPASVSREGDVVQVIASVLTELGREQGQAGLTLPPLGAAMVGAIGWDALYTWEPKLRRAAQDELGLPDVAMTLVQDVVALDHHAGEVWLLTVCYDAHAHDYNAAVARLDAMEAGLAQSLPVQLSSAVERAEVAHRYRTAREDFEAAVVRGKEAIADGEVFQVVLSQRTDVECKASSLAVYRALRSINPSPYMYLFEHVDAHGRPFTVVGSSPETLVRVTDGQVYTFPIAGSRPRSGDAQLDRERVADLLADPKELSEHTMLVDLARNDLSKVCVPASVSVAALMEIKHFSHIMHISSTVTGQLRPGRTALDALVATFPAGTLSGAPKPRAIELIDELEPARRGFYGGVVGYLGLDGNADLAITIRTAIIRDGVAHVQAGAGVVADSVPRKEHEETRHKAAAMLSAIQVAVGVRN
ncbi:chorismate-binding protein [Buchananella felis]|uniref:chorismate-binding protein n=1 Tax=Buchananella felis TaxID=3231492 RepID=UPI00352866AC